MDRLSYFLETVRAWFYSRQYDIYFSDDAYFPWRAWLIGIAGIGGIAVIVASIIILQPAEDTVVSDKTNQAGFVNKNDQKNSDTYYRVVKVVDGDTIDVSIDNKTERVRLIGVDTPETVDSRKTVQCFGEEASSKAKEMLGSKMIRLEPDPTQGERDKYSRLLRYVYLQDGTDFNKYMIAEGYAHEYTYRIPYNHQSEYMEAEKQARSNNKGLWSPASCDGDTTGADESKKAPERAPVTVPRAQAPPPQSSVDCDPNYSPCVPNVSYDLDCADIGMSVTVLGYDTHRFDRDGDGYGCEPY